MNERWNGMDHCEGMKKIVFGWSMEWTIPFQNAFHSLKIISSVPLVFFPIPLPLHSSLTTLQPTTVATTPPPPSPPSSAAVTHLHRHPPPPLPPTFVLATAVAATHRRHCHFQSSPSPTFESRCCNGILTYLTNVDQKSAAKSGISH
ncbi:hypothetical protein HanPI659440_Chr11g0410361 [Helianthus annuus]|nr:hypothetical protein HanPI659440_Chr11g0410361 [Helianthus annuus]